MSTPLPTALLSSNQVPVRPQKLIESILEVRTVSQYLIKWKNIPETGNTWELVDNVKARIKSKGIVVPLPAGTLEAPTHGPADRGSSSTSSSTKRKAGVKESSPEILPPPKRASVTMSKSSGFSPAPSTPSISVSFPGPDLEEQAQVFPESAPDPSLYFGKGGCPIPSIDDDEKPEEKVAHRKEKKHTESKLHERESSDAMFDDGEGSYAERVNETAVERETKNELDVIYGLGSPISEDAELFGEPEDTEIKVESRMDIKTSPRPSHQDEDSSEAFMSELDHEDAISVDRLETAILSDEDLSFAGAMSNTVSPMKRRSEVRTNGIPGGSSIQARLERYLSPHRKEASTPTPLSPVPVPSPLKTRPEQAQAMRLRALLTGGRVLQSKEPKEDLPSLPDEISQVIGASLENDVFRIRIKWIEKTSRKVRTGWVEEDVYQEWDAPLQELIKNFFKKYGIPSLDKPEIKAERMEEEEDSLTIWAV
ncbi:hypothetical protein RvY_18183 [Ramazzottius varieornatus]|uniref:Chromo domain-containing protein n=1 Tax=Ramazzottius varieornatus TaxID=947166 RepID=A0A1D1W4X8_RAMVA|nr:hypothetical protein RvY_18183 [Ramazzottius varieornatus]